MNWYCHAANQGYSFAEFRLATMYSRGNGVPQDNITAYAWLSIAGKDGLSEALEAKSDLVKSMTQQQIAEGQSRIQEITMKNTKSEGKYTGCMLSDSHD